MFSLLRFSFGVCFVLACVLSPVARAQHNSITVPCSGPIEAPPGGLRAASDGNTWEFSLVPGAHTQLYDQHWFFNGIAPTTPNMATAWGQLLGGQDGSNSLMWLSPTQGGTYSIKVKAKRRCTLTGGGGGGDAFDPNFEISWGVEVAAKKTWDVGTVISASLTSPVADTKAAPGDAVPCSVTAADNDHWKQGDAPDAEQGTAADELTYQWSASGGFFSGSGASVSWTPPNATGSYTLTCIVDDKPTALSPIDDGTRDDAPLTVSVEVEVPPRTWSASAAIGAALNDKGKPMLKSDGSALVNGRVLSPQDQTLPKPDEQAEYPVLQVLPKETVSCLVEEATDWDKWTRQGAGTESDANFGRLHGTEKDEVKYLWSADGGSFKDGKTDMPAATWIAPLAVPDHPNDNVYTLTCTMSDVPKTVTAPDEGTRDDTENLVRTIKVQVVDSESWMALKLFKDGNVGNDWEGDPGELVAGTIGGDLLIAVDVQVGGKTSIVVPPSGGEYGSGFKIKVTEHDGEGLHDEADNHAFWDVGIGGGGWRKWNFVTEKWEATTETPGALNDTSTPKRFRRLLPWTTTAEKSSTDPDVADHGLKAGKLWGHNASHSVELEYSEKQGANWKIDHFATFQPQPVNGVPQAAYQFGPNRVGADVGNLVVSSIRTNGHLPDYVILDYPGTFPEIGENAEQDPDELGEDNPAEDAEVEEWLAEITPEMEEEIQAENQDYQEETIDPRFLQPTIEFSIEDKGEPTQYRWVVYLRPSNRTYWLTNWQNEYQDAWLMGNATAPGTISVDWNGRLSNNSGEKLEQGTYAIDIAVWKVDNAASFQFNEADVLDSYAWKSPELLSFKGAVTDATGHEHNGHGISVLYDFTAPEDAPRARIHYQVEDTRNVDAKHIDVHLLDNKFGLRSTYQGPALNKEPYADKDIYFLNPTDHGTWRGIFTAEDNLPGHYRDHRTRRTVSVNQIVDQAEKAVKVQTSEIAARNYFLKHQASKGWQMIVDPGARHPYAYGGPDVCLWRRAQNGKIIVAFIDNKMFESTGNIGSGYMKGLTYNWYKNDGWREHAARRVRELAISPTLQNEIIAAINNPNQVRRYVMNCGGLSKGVTWWARNKYKVQFIDVKKELGKGAYKALLVGAKIESELFFARRTQTLNTIRRSLPSLFGKGSSWLKRAGKGITPLSIALAALTLYDLGPEKGSQRILEQSLFIDEARAVQAWGAAGIDKIIANGRAQYWKTPHGQQLKEAYSYYPE
jgi:hypothetical protein